jgi:hypothetical protein
VSTTVTLKFGDDLASTRKTLLTVANIAFGPSEVTQKRASVHLAGAVRSCSGSFN